MTHLSTRERDLALTVLAMSVSVLPVEVTLWPQTSTDKAPSWQFSMNSSVILILKSWNQKDQSLYVKTKLSRTWKIQGQCFCCKHNQFCIIRTPFHVILTFLCWNLTVTVSPMEFCRSNISGLTWGGTTTDSSWPQNVYWQNTKFDMAEGRPLAERMVSWNVILNVSNFYMWCTCVVIWIRLNFSMIGGKFHHLKIILKKKKIVQKLFLMPWTAFETYPDNHWSPCWQSRVCFLNVLSCIAITF